MSLPKKKGTLRQTFFIAAKHKKFVNVGKLSPRYLFRAAIRLVIEYKEWIVEDILSGPIDTDININVKKAKQKKSADNVITLQDRKILLIPPNKRDKKDVEYIQCLLKKINAFKQFSPEVRDELAEDIIYQYVPAGRTITRQDHKAYVEYYIIKGQAQILKTVFDSLTGEKNIVEVGSLQSGDVFGEISLLHEIPRAATVVTTISNDLLLITKSVFDDVVRHVLLTEWSELRDALVNFNYFKGWTEETMRECCILSKINHYKPDEVLLGDGNGMVHYVYFLLSGECQLIEHMNVIKKVAYNKTKYNIFDYQDTTRNHRSRVSKIDKSTLRLDETATSEKAIDENTSPEELIQLLAKKKKTTVAMDRISVITVTLQDVINEWHEITDVMEMLKVEPCMSAIPTSHNLSTVFMQICLFYRGACFGLGEQMKNRRVISLTPVKCLLIPRYWLLQHNRANIWRRVKDFLNTNYPTNKQLLKNYIESKKWAKYKRDYANDIISRNNKLRNDTKMYHVPYYIRINEDLLNDE